MTKQTFYTKLLREIHDALTAVSYTERISDVPAPATVTLEQGLEKLCAVTRTAADAHARMYILGNGASNALASAMSLEFVQNAGIDAVSFTSSAYLTAMSNDEGGGRLFTCALEHSLRPADMLVAISSSGKSKNILNALQLASSRGCRTVTFTAMQRDNPASIAGDMNFYVPINTYSGAEIAHYTLMQIWYERYMARYLPEKLPEKYANRQAGGPK